tara:strand:- start:5062 stop:5256 length:195 start_codon:yes stop_codon:yes gene_type:complete
MINNIDVSLRDGGYINNFNFNMNYIKSHVEHVYKSGIEWIEIGYRKGSFNSSPSSGLTGLGSNQ